MPKGCAPRYGVTDGSLRQCRQTNFIAIGNERQIDPAERRNLLLPIGAAYGRFNDQKALRCRVPFELKTSQTPVLCRVEKSFRQRSQNGGRFGRGDADRRIADTRRMRHNLSAIKDSGGLMVVTAMKETEIDIAVRPIDPLLNNDLSGRMQHSPANGLRIVRRNYVIDTSGVTCEDTAFLGRLRNERIPKARKLR